MKTIISFCAFLCQLVTYREFSLFHRFYFNINIFLSMEKKDSFLPKLRIAESYKKDLHSMATEEKREDHDFQRVLLETAVDKWRKKKKPLKAPL